MIIRSAVCDLGIKHIISSKIEHPCVLNTVLAIEDVQVHYVELTENGYVDIEHLDELLGSISDKCLVSLMHANNEIGNLLDIEAVGEICKKHDAIFHSDTVQTLGHFRIDLQKINLHFMTGSGHKLHGPKGIGIVYVSSDLKIKPLITGGSQERNMRGGTENVYGIVGFGEAIAQAYEHLDEDREYINGLKKYMAEELKSFIPEISFNGDPFGECLYTVLNVSFPPHEKNNMLLFNLDIAGICASSGSACSAGVDTDSHVLTAIKAPPERTSIRFSFSKYNTKDEIDFAIGKIKELFVEKVTA